MWPSRAVKLGGVRITAEMPPGSDGPSTTFIRNAGIDLNAGCSCLTTAISAISIGTTTGSSSGGGNTILAGDDGSRHVGDRHKRLRPVSEKLISGFLCARPMETQIIVHD